MDINADCNVGVTVKEEIVENNSACDRGIAPVVGSEAMELNCGVKEESHNGYLCDNAKNECDPVSADAQIPDSHITVDDGTGVKFDPDVEELLLDLGAVPSYNLIDPPDCGFICGICGHTADRKSELEQHMDSHVGEEGECSSSSSESMANFRKSRKASGTRNQFICHFCNHRSHTKRLIKKHIDITHMDKKPYSSKAYEFHHNTLKRKRKKVAMKKHANRKLKCDVCGHRTSEPSELKVHILLKHTDEKPYACNRCGYRSAVEHYLKTHMLTCTGRKPFACEICDYRCRQIRSLKMHELKHKQHSLPLKKLRKFDCHLCDYKTHVKSVLKKHLMRHSGEKQHACEICDYRCVEKQRLKIHMLTHTGEKPFRCNICDYSSRQKVHLQDHMRQHSREKKSVSCYLCGYRCVNKRYLRAHMVDHGIRPQRNGNTKAYPCEYCNFCSKHPGHVKDHMLVHTGEKPWACNVCDYRARQKGQLNTHMRIHTGEKPYSCDFCHYRSRQKNHLIGHMKLYCLKKPIPQDRLNSNVIGSFTESHMNMTVTSGITGPTENRSTECDEADTTNPFLCDFCNYRSQYSGYVKKHMTHCPYKPKERDPLSDHSNDIGSFSRSPINTTSTYGITGPPKFRATEDVVADTPKPYSCDFCNRYQSNYISNVKRHMAHCSQNPKLRAQLNDHSNVIGSVTRSPMNTTAEPGDAAATKPYKCNFCNYCSWGMSHVHSHMKYCGRKDEPKPFNPLSDHRNYVNDSEPPRNTSGQFGNTASTNLKKVKEGARSVRHNIPTEIKAVIRRQNFDHNYSYRGMMHHENPLCTSSIVAEPYEGESQDSLCLSYAASINWRQKPCSIPQSH